MPFALQRTTVSVNLYCSYCGKIESSRESHGMYLSVLSDRVGFVFGDD